MSPVAPVAVADSDAVSATSSATRPQSVPAASIDADIADWLRAHPEFFDTHAELLGEIRVRHPLGGRAVSLVERQVQVLRDRNEALQARLEELIRFGQENDAIVARTQQLAESLLSESDAQALAACLLAALQQHFGVPQVAVRVWRGAFGEPFGEPVSPEFRRCVDELREPYCGPNTFPEAAGWLAGGGAETRSLALLALRAQPQADPFGVLVMGSEDAGRFQAGMGTAFLQRLGALAGAALSRAT